MLHELPPHTVSPDALVFLQHLPAGHPPPLQHDHLLQFVAAFSAMAAPMRSARRALRAIILASCTDGVLQVGRAERTRCEEGCEMRWVRAASADGLRLAFCTSQQAVVSNLTQQAGPEKKKYTALSST